MNLKELARAKVVVRTLELECGKSVDIRLRQMPFHMLWDNSDENGDPIPENKKLANRVAYCVVDEDNHPIFTSDQVLGNDPDFKMDPSFVLKLATLVGGILDAGKPMRKNSDTTKSSGANLSSTESGGAP